MADYDQVQDSGTRQSFDTGSVRDTQAGKGRFDLISPEVTRRDAKHMENGAVKYGVRNWEKGQPLMRYLDSALRHINAWQLGMTDEDHLAAARWNLGCIMHTEWAIRLGLLPEELDDSPCYTRGRGE